MSTASTPEADPTRSRTRRKKFARTFRSRWRDARGTVRQLIEGDRHYRPQSRTANSKQVADFRQWLESMLAETVTDQTPHRAVRKGRHYTAPYIRELYRHGIRRADDELRASGFEFDAPTPEAAIRHGAHKEHLAGFYVEVYQDVEDAVRATVKEATRAYREAVREQASQRDTIQRLNGRADPRGRLRAIGETRTNLVAKTKAVKIINTAALARYQQVGLEQVGVQVEGVAADVRTEANAAGEIRYTTAQDADVCPECRALGGNVYQISEVQANGPKIPRHPNCRCLYTPTPAEVGGTLVDEQGDPIE